MNIRAGFGMQMCAASPGEGKIDGQMQWCMGLDWASAPARTPQEASTAARHSTAQHKSHIWRLLCIADAFVLPDVSACIHSRSPPARQTMHTLTIPRADMAASTLFGCMFIALAFPAAMFIFTVRKSPKLVVVVVSGCVSLACSMLAAAHLACATAYSAFAWLVGMLIASGIWNMAIPIKVRHVVPQFVLQLYLSIRTG